MISLSFDEVLSECRSLLGEPVFSEIDQFGRFDIRYGEFRISYNPDAYAFMGQTYGLWGGYPGFRYYTGAWFSSIDLLRAALIQK